MGYRYNNSSIRNAFRYLRSLVVLPDGDEEAIRLIHPSLQDFLTNAKRCKDERFLVISEHTRLAGCCARKLVECLADLHRDSQVKEWLKSKGNFEIIIEDAILSYSHSYFACHLEKSDLDKELLDALHGAFLEPKMKIYHAGRDPDWIKEFCLILFRLISTLPVSVYRRVNQEYLHYYCSVKEQHSFRSGSVVCIYECAMYYVNCIYLNGHFVHYRSWEFSKFVAPIREAKCILSKRLPYDA